MIFLCISDMVLDKDCAGEQNYLLCPIGKSTGNPVVAGRCHAERCSAALKFSALRGLECFGTSAFAAVPAEKTFFWEHVCGQWMQTRLPSGSVRR
jgi:hypothetical protein